MNKAEFVNQLSAGLTGLSQEDIKRSVDFYTEMIDDRIEDGMSEDEAVEALGSIDEIRNRILEEIPITRIVKEKITPKRSFRAWEIILLILGAPVWIPLLLSLIVVCLVLYLCFWIIILALYVVDLSVFVSGIAGILGGIIQAGGAGVMTFFIGCGIALLGLGVLLFFGFNQVSKGMLFLSKKIAVGIKRMFVGGKTDEN